MDLSAFNLQGKVALITGGAHGIGFSIAEGMALAKQQARLDRQTHLERPGIGDHAPAVLGRHNQKIRVGRCGIIAA